MLRKLYVPALVVLTACSLSLSLNSCSDDDGPVGTQEPDIDRPTVTDNPTSTQPLSPPALSVFDDTMPTAAFGFEHDIILSYSNTISYSIGDNNTVESERELDLYLIERNRVSLNGFNSEITVENFGLDPKFTLHGNDIWRNGVKLPGAGPDLTDMDGQRNHEFRFQDEFSTDSYGIPSFNLLDVKFDYLNSDLTQSASEDLVLNWTGDVAYSPTDFYLVQIRGGNDGADSWQSRILRKTPSQYVFTSDELQRMNVGTSGLFYARIARYRCLVDRIHGVDCLLCTSTAAVLELTLLD